jgi:hypothetical protein
MVQSENGELGRMLEKAPTLILEAQEKEVRLSPKQAVESPMFS